MHHHIWLKVILTLGIAGLVIALRPSNNTTNVYYRPAPSPVATNPLPIK